MILVGSILVKLDLLKDSHPVIIVILSIITLFGTHLLLKKIVKRDHEKYAKEISENYSKLLKIEIVIIVILLITSLFLIGFFSFFE